MGFVMDGRKVAGKWKKSGSFAPEAPFPNLYIFATAFSSDSLQNSY